MKEYRVIWAIDIDAESPIEAAVKALMVQRDKNSSATMFEVTPRCEDCGKHHDGDVNLVDLATVTEEGSTRAH